MYRTLKKISNDDERKTIPIWWSLIILLCCGLIFGLVLLNYLSIPTALLEEDEPMNPDRFIGERAQRINYQLTNLGIKVAGSRINEVNAIEYLQQEVLKIINVLHPNQTIEYEIQSESGSFQLYSMTSVYRGTQNFIAKLSPANSNPAFSLLLNTHFDSVPISKGGSDACTMAAVMMEVLRKLATSSETFQHSIVFLFNGAEENGLQGSHAFITHHRWAKDIRALINMDASGSGGREVLFQTTQHYTWLMKYYSKTALHPFGTTLGEEIFQSNAIPSDTDFRIFRDFGKIPGVDLAVYRNGYVYHTKFDTAEIIPMGTFQNTGDNVLALTKALANADELNDLDASKDASSSLIFFDYLGWFMITYTLTEGIILNVCISIISLIVIILSLWNFSRQLGLTKCELATEFGIIMAIQIVSVILAVTSVLTLASIYDAIGKSMTWYTDIWTVFGTYYCPFFYSLGLAPALYLTLKKKKTITLSYQVQMFLQAQCILLVLLLLILTIIGIRSAFLILIAIIFYTLTSFINWVSGLENRDKLWIIVHLIGQILPLMFYMHYSIYALDSFVPIQGRSGPSSNPDTFIAVVTLMTGLFLGGFLMPIFCMCRKRLLIIGGFFVVFLIFLIVTLATRVGFPYKTDYSPQRFWIFHTERVLYNYDQTENRTDAGYFMLNMDRHSNDLILDYVVNVTDAVGTGQNCTTEMFCGVPLYTSRMIDQAGVSNWVNAAKPIYPMPPNLTLLNLEHISGNISRFHFEISGSDHLNIFLAPKEGAILRNWDVMSYVPEVKTWQNRMQYFLFVTSATATTPYQFFIDIEKPAEQINSPSMDIALVAHYNHHDEFQTDEFRQFIASFPDWTHVTPWMATYFSYQY